MIFTLLLTLAWAERPLPDYTDDLAQAAWHTINTLIEDACVGEGPARYCNKQELDEAVVEVDRFERNLFADARLEYLAGLAYKLADKPDLATQRFRKALGLDSGRKDAWHDLGEIALAAGRLDEADQAFAEVERLVPEGRFSWLGPWRRAEVAAARHDPEAFEQHIHLALRRGFSFRTIRGQPNWRSYYADPAMHDVIQKLITVYGDPDILESLAPLEP